jgi:hypothetical protein
MAEPSDQSSPRAIESPTWWNPIRRRREAAVSVQARENDAASTLVVAGPPEYYYAFVDGIEEVRSPVPFPGRFSASASKQIYTQYRFDCLAARNFDVNVPKLWLVDPGGKHVNLDPSKVKKRFAEQKLVIRGGNHCMIYITVPREDTRLEKRARLTHWYLLIVSGESLVNAESYQAQLFDDVPLDDRSRFFGDRPIGMTVTHIEPIPNDVRDRLLEVVSFNHIPDIVLPRESTRSVSVAPRSGPSPSSKTGQSSSKNKTRRADGTSETKLDNSWKRHGRRVRSPP